MKLHCKVKCLKGSSKIPVYESYCYTGRPEQIVLNNRTRLRPPQFLNVLLALRATIVDEADPRMLDCTDIGDRNIHCDWGLCSDRLNIYPEAELHIFPLDFDKYQRMTPLAPPEGFDCHMRDRHPNDLPGMAQAGCYHQCRCFQRRKKTPTKLEALGMIDKLIRKVRICIAQQGKEKVNGQST